MLFIVSHLLVLVHYYLSVQWQCAVLRYSYALTVLQSNDGEWHSCPEAAGQACSLPLVSASALYAMQNQERMRKWVYFSIVPLRGYCSMRIL